ncbi:glycosyltransferase [Streptomyces glaucosporus]|uniref:D-inositol 3-phosphate glycosyltransferase n=1 Tax=Streptomyces glaucosporus TaxID=284044 RepID=A0ABN3ICP2_9ACTN
MRIALLTEGGYPYPDGDSVVWCDRLVRGLADHEFEVYALGRGERQREGAWPPLPGNVRRVRTAPLWGPVPAADGRRGRHRYGRRERRRFGEHFAELAAAVCAEPGSEGAASQADRFAEGLHGLADLARERGGLPAALRSEQAVRLLESACRAPGALRAVRAAVPADLLTVTEQFERLLRPLSADWYGGPGKPAGPAHRRGSGLAAADVCHAVGAGPAALPGLLAGRLFGTPLLVTEYGARLREHCLTSAAHAVAPDAVGAPVRALLAAFHARLAHEVYRRAELITSGNAHTRSWQLRGGADRDRLRTVHPGTDASPFTGIEEDGGQRRPDPLLVWTGRIEPARDLVCLLHAFAEVRRTVPGARLLIAERPGGPGAASGRTPEAEAYLAHCRALAAQLFPDEAAGPHSVGDNPVCFARIGDPEAPRLPDAYAAADVAVLSSVVEGFPVPLVEAMLSGRATVSTDVGAVYEAVGGTGLVVPPRNPRALAAACAALLGDPARRARLGAAARARALELFTAERNVAAFRGIYLELLSHRPEPAGRPTGARPFARPPEAHLPGHWAGPGTGRPVRRPSWARTSSGPAAVPAGASAGPREGRR